MLTIEYNPNTDQNLIPDGKILNFVEGEINTFQQLYSETLDRSIIIGNQLVIDAFRLAIKQDRIKNTDVVFKYNNELMYPDNDGKLPLWPEGFCDTHSIILAGLCSRRIRDGY
jgi:hypothetical protein